MLQAILRTPVVIFQMGKVGSSSLETTLSKKFNGTVIHAHQYATLNANQQRHLAWRRRLHLPVYLISPVREPIARNISAFFQNFRRDTGLELSAREWTVPELRDLFLQHYPHNTCLEWFDAHLRTSFGIDVLSEPFPIEKKWHTYKKGSVRLLVYRTDLDHTQQLDIVARFLGCALDRWDYANLSEDKEFAGIYKTFCAAVTLPELYLNLMYQSRFSRKFWSAEEMAEYAKKWRG